MFSDIRSRVAEALNVPRRDREGAKHPLTGARRQTLKLNSDALNRDFQGEGHGGQLLECVSSHSDCPVVRFATATGACPAGRRNAGGRLQAGPR